MLPLKAMSESMAMQKQGSITTKDQAGISGTCKCLTDVQNWAIPDLGIVGKLTWGGGLKTGELTQSLGSCSTQKINPLT